MADELSKETQDSLAKMIEERFSAGLSDFARTQDERAAAREQQRQEEEAARQQQEQLRQQQEKDGFGQMVQPYITPAFQAVAVQNQVTQDFVDFYLSHPEFVSRKQEIEAKFQMVQKQLGRPLPRLDIIKHIVGEERLKVDQEEANKRAQEALVLGGGSGLNRQVTERDPYSMTLAELEESLAGKYF